MSISSRNTKAEILTALRQAEQQLAQGPTWRQAASKVKASLQTAWREFTLLVGDTYNAGAATRRAVVLVVDELSKPVLR